MSEKTVLFRPRLKADVDAKLRGRIFRRGELIQMVVLILKTVDLSTMPILEMGDDLRTLATTTVKLPAALHAKLKKVAEKRRISINTLVNSAIWEYKDEPPKDQP